MSELLGPKEDKFQCIESSRVSVGDTEIGWNYKVYKGKVLTNLCVFDRSHMYHHNINLDCKRGSDQSLKEVIKLQKLINDYIECLQKYSK
jgi:hypothetical protein